MFECQRKTPDFIIVAVTLILLTVGMIMVYSASAAWASYKFQDSFFLRSGSFLFAGLGVVAMFIIMRIDYWIWRDYSKLILLVCFFVPDSRADSWNRTGTWRSPKLDWSWCFFSIQPSEFMKFAMIVFFYPNFFIRAAKKRLPPLKKGLAPSLGIVFF
ncbi:hypothetical protein GCM10020331_045660 [Ectobacillus funiculus]